MVTGPDLLARLDALLPVIAAESDATDRRGAVADTVIEGLRDVGIFATLAPRAYGGHELGLDSFAEIIRRISAASPSSGWVAAFLMGAAWRLLLFPRDGQEEMYGGRNYVLGAGTAQPITAIERVEGGYLLSGRTAWNSGASHAQWFTINGLLRGSGGAPELLSFALPRRDVTILDTWHILGMQGTASTDIVVDRAFVPDRRTAPFLPALEGRSAGHALHANPMYRIPFIPFAMTEVLPVVVGTHRGAAEALLARTRSRTGTISGAKAAGRGAMQTRLGQTLARASMAEQMLAAMVAQNMAGGDAAATPRARAEVKLHAAMVTTFCLDSVNEMARSVGGDGFRDDAPFQRYFRDINTVARHTFLDPEIAGETVGRLALDQPIDDPLV